MLACNGKAIKSYIRFTSKKAYKEKIATNLIKKVVTPFTKISFSRHRKKSCTTNNVSVQANLNNNNTQSDSKANINKYNDNKTVEFHMPKIHVYIKRSKRAVSKFTLFSK